MMDRAEEWAIYRLAARLAQAGDDRDEAAYRACLADAVWSGPAHQGACVPRETYARDAMERLSRTVWTHHLLANPVIAVDERGRSADAAIDVVVTACLAMGVMGEEPGRRITCGGRYELGFERGATGWCINRRFLRIRYRHGEAPG
jgi:hypothetical protein